jgi:predicted DNA-binding protein with PD1-like motif
MQAEPLHLDAGSDVRSSLEQFARERNVTGFVLSVVGNLAQAAFACPGSNQPMVLAGELEIITLQGTISPTGVHLHLSFSDVECAVWGGHLEHGTMVLRGAELLIGLLTTSAITKSRVEIAGLPQCPYSRRALRMLRTLGIPFAEISPKSEESVPQIFVDGRFIGGYNALAELHSKGELEHLRN